MYKFNILIIYIMSGNTNNYIINGVNTYGIGTSIVQVAEEGLSLTTTTDNFSMNGLGFTYNGSGATWNDVRQKVQDLKAVVAPPDITTMTVNNKIQVTNGTNTTTINPASITSATFTGSLNGTANFASTTVVTVDNSSPITYPTFVTGTSGNQGQKVDTNLTYNALSNTLTVPNLDGNASTASTASVSNNVNNAAVTTGGPYGVAYMNNSAGTTFISSDTAGSHLTFNPSSNTLATRFLTVNGATTAISAPNATAISFPSATVTATTFTGALNGNANTATNANTANIATNSTITADNTGSTFYPTFVSNTGTQGLKIDNGLYYVPSTDTLTVANLNGNANTANNSTSTYNLNALNPITPYYTYPIGSPANIGWTQVITTTGWTFNSITKAYACNTTPLVAGIYIMRAYVYCGNSSFYTGTQQINLVASNSFINNNSTTGFVDPSNAGPMGYMYSRIPYNTGDSVNNAPFVVNNTGAGFYPYWAIAVNNSVQINPAGNGVPQMNFCRIA
jgi:hypothetical protein